MSRRLFAPFFLLLSFPLLASAQEATAGSGATTGSGTVLEETASLKTMRTTRTKDFRSKMLAFLKADSQYRSRENTFRTKRAELWRACREDLRRANRDTKFPTTLRCFRGTITLEKEFLGDQSDWLAAMPGVPNAIRSVAVSRLDLLREAVNTVLLGIDGKVYATNDDVLEARKNLLEKYRLPFAESLSAARAEMLLTWNQEILQSLDAATASDGAPLDDAGKAAWADARTRLLRSERTLLGFHDADTAPSAAELRAAMTDLRACADAVASLPLVARQSSSSSSSQP